MEKEKTAKAKKPAKPKAATAPKKPRAVKKPATIEPVAIPMDQDAIVPGASVKDAYKEGRFFEAVGRRKTSVARIRLFTQGEKTIIVNNKPYEQYFNEPDLQKTATASLEKMKCNSHFRVESIVRGGGIHSQAEAIRHGISRALVKFNADFRKRLRRAGYLTRDSRARERKKFGFKRARKSAQWAKR